MGTEPPPLKLCRAQDGQQEAAILEEDSQRTFMLKSLWIEGVNQVYT